MLLGQTIAWGLAVAHGGAARARAADAAWAPQRHPTRSTGGAPLAVYSAPNCSLAHLCAGPRHVYVADCRNHVVHRLAVWRDAEGAEAPSSTASSPAK